jgi:hypothetical protein
VQPQWRPVRDIGPWVQVRRESAWVERRA